MIDCIIALQRIVDELYQRQLDVQLTRPDPKFGDFATNVALQLAKPLGKNSREIAEAIAAKLRADEAWFYQCEVERPSGAGVVESAPGDQTRWQNGSDRN